MAKMFYSEQEAGSKLGMDRDGLRNMVASGRLREFRDRDRRMYSVQDVNALSPREPDCISIFDAEDQSDGLLDLEPDDLTRDGLDIDLSDRAIQPRLPVEREDVVPDPEEARQTLPTSDGIFLLSEIDRALAISAALDRPRAKALIGLLDKGYDLASRRGLRGDEETANRFIGELKVKEWEQLREELRDPETRVGLTSEIASKRLGHVRDLVLQALSRTDRPTYRDVEGVNRDLSILKGIHFAQVYDKAASAGEPRIVEVDMLTERAFRRAQEIAKGMVERITQKQATI